MCRNSACSAAPPTGSCIRKSAKMIDALCADFQLALVVLSLPTTWNTLRAHTQPLFDQVELAAVNYTPNDCCIPMNAHLRHHDCEKVVRHFSGLPPTYPLPSNGGTGRGGGVGGYSSVRGSMSGSSVMAGGASGRGVAGASGAGTMVGPQGVECSSILDRELFSTGSVRVLQSSTFNVTCLFLVCSFHVFVLLKGVGIGYRNIRTRVRLQAS